MRRAGVKSGPQFLAGPLSKWLYLLEPTSLVCKEGIERMVFGG